MMLFLLPSKTHLPLLGILAPFVLSSRTVGVGVTLFGGTPASLITGGGRRIPALGRFIHRDDHGAVVFLQEQSSAAAVAVAVTAVPRGGGDVHIDSPLTAGMAVLCMATTPYVLGLFSKYCASKLLVYDTSTSDKRLAAYKEETYWVCMYNALALSLTLFQFWKVSMNPNISSEEVLKESFFVWAIFYTLAWVKIHIENTKDLLSTNQNGVNGIQSWHLFVALSMWAAIAGSQYFVGFMNTFFNLFSSTPSGPCVTAGSIAILVSAAILFWHFKIP